MYPYIGLDGDYAIYKAFVDTNDTCNASAHLFIRLIDTKYEPEAVTYFISNPSISNNQNFHFLNLKHFYSRRIYL